MKIIFICVNSEHQACNLSIIIYFNICLSEDDICARCSPSKLDPAGPAYQKMKNSKKFDPAKSAVLEVAMEKYYNNKKYLLRPGDGGAGAGQLRGGHGGGAPSAGGGGQARGRADDLEILLYCGVIL